MCFVNDIPRNVLLDRLIKQITKPHLRAKFSYSINYPVSKPHLVLYLFINVYENTLTRLQVQVIAVSKIFIAQAGKHFYYKQV